MTWYWWALLLIQAVLDAYLLVISIMLVLSFGFMNKKLKALESAIWVMAKNADQRFEINDTNIGTITKFLIDAFALKEKDLEKFNDMKN